MKKLGLLLLSSLLMVGCSSKKSDSTSESDHSGLLPEGLIYSEFEDETNGNYYIGFVDVYNQPEGNGTMYYGNGDMYEGSFSAGLKEGVGTMTFYTACVYIGEWENDYMHGQGYMIWPNGDYFNGEWRYGNPYYGTKYFLQPDAPIDGTVEQRYCIYHGSFDSAGLLSGYGTMSWPSGDYYVGMFEDNVRHGQGTQYWPSRDENIPQYSFVGEFSKDHGGWIYGEGTMYYRDGHQETGTWDGTDKVA